MSEAATYEPVLQFWFAEIETKAWWVPTAGLDQLITARFAATLEQARSGELYPWRTAPRGRLAEIIVLDQFSRNIHRNTPLAFAQDPLALALAQEAIAAGAEAALTGEERAFLYMPFMHSESRLIHECAEVLFRRLGLKDHLDADLKHKAMIDRFGRYPHRNAVLGRTSTAAELAFLAAPGSSF
jgi:uncharacterized protein (DUF924 family)